MEEGAPLTKTMISPARLEVSTAKTPDLSSLGSNSKRLRMVSRATRADFCEERCTGRLTRLRSCSHTAELLMFTVNKPDIFHTTDKPVSDQSCIHSILTKC